MLCVTARFGAKTLDGKQDIMQGMQRIMRPTLSLLKYKNNSSWEELVQHSHDQGQSTQSTLAGVCLRHLRAQPFLSGELVRGRTILKAFKYKERRVGKTAKEKPNLTNPGVNDPLIRGCEELALLFTCSKVNIKQLTKASENYVRRNSSKN